MELSTDDNQSCHFSSLSWRSSVLPSIISESKKDFINNISEQIKTELQKTDCPDKGPDEQRYIVYKHAFDKVIHYCSAYKHILSFIKQEYDDYISFLQKERCYANYLHGKLQLIAAEPATLVNLQQRATELQDKIEIINQDSCKFQTNLQKLKEAELATTPPANEELHLAKIDPARPVQGLTSEESVDIKALTKHLYYLEKKLQKLQQIKDTKYVPFQVQDKLQQTLHHAVLKRKEATSGNYKLKLRHNRLKILSDAIMSWTESDKHVPLLKFLPQTLLTAASLKASTAEQGSHTSREYEEDDPSKIKEAEILLQCIERFNELLESGQYEAAAIHAATSPQNILQHMKTVQRLKSITITKGETSPLLLYFESVLNSSAATSYPPDVDLSLEAVNCALKENRLDLVVHWITQQRLSFSDVLGDVICKYGEKEPQHMDMCLALAQAVYTKCALYVKAVLCMCLRGQICGAMEYIHNWKTFTLDDYLFLLKNCASMNLIQKLTQPWNGKPAVISVGFAVLALVSTDNKEIGFQLLETIKISNYKTLEQVILTDEICSPEGWKKIADECSINNYNALAEEIMSIITSQDGILEISGNDDDRKIMEHVFM
ncbi:clathrin heavy chain linker domain-containing protein 1 [Protopterus annectens]|uniref:clathrin heavy chain linker domain-containing protein 1 n=1 Tax=Protopterus annectens TaxID=7888 RepID=UPI001CF947BB|nr:clathrin heavy chain linker domain-containing protein 1 [Protopterus annectens]